MINVTILSCKKHRTVHLPWGFHIISDLVPLFRMREELTRTQLSREARMRLRWFDSYRTCGNVTKICQAIRYLSPDLLRVESRYNPHNLLTLEDKPKAPKTKRQRTITPEEESRIVALRKE
jgi:hypothetical protein